jgi:uncharacterized protein (TIRG00374 family)
MQRLQHFSDSPAGRILRYVVSVGLLAWLVLSVDWIQVRDNRGSIDWATAAAGLLLAGLAFPLMAWRWKILLNAQGIQLPFSWAHQGTWAGNFASAFLPGGIGGDAARLYWVFKDAPDKRAGGLIALLLDRILGLLVLLLLAVAGLLLKVGALGAEAQSLLVLLIMAVVGACLVLLLLCTINPKRLPAWTSKYLNEERREKLVLVQARVVANPIHHVVAAILSFAVWLVDFVALACLARAVDLNLDFIDICIAGAVGYTAASLPVSIGGHGVREGSLIWALLILGISNGGETLDRSTLTLFALLAWGTVIVWNLAGAPAFFLSRVRSKRDH